MFTISVDTGNASLVVDNMINQITELGEKQMPSEMQAWQAEEFNREKLNVESGRVGRGAFVSTRFWRRRTSRYVKHWILRPEKKAVLFRRMTELAQEELTWRR
jgi:hypothetical protein